MPAPSPVLPPLDGSLSVLPGFVDFHATHNAELPWALLSAGPELPVQSVSFAQYARATHRVAHALRPVRRAPARALARVQERARALLHRAQVRRLRERGRVPHLERVEVRLERVVVREEPRGVQAARFADGDAVGLGLSERASVVKA